MLEDAPPPAPSDATLWTTILKARDGSGEEQGRAMERLLHRYQGLIQRQILCSLPVESRSMELAKDLTQSFIEHCLQNDFLRRVDPGKGRFRSFLRQCIRNHLVEEHRKRTAAKRDAGLEAFSLNQTTIDGQVKFEPASGGVALDEALDRQWALDLVDRAMQSLAEECERNRRSRVFDALKGSLMVNSERQESVEAARKLGMSEANIRTALHRLRARLGELIREEVRETVGSEEDWREELAYLISLLGKQVSA